MSDSASNLLNQRFDVAAELTAANASIHDGRSAQLTPSILKSRDSAFSYPFLRGDTALHAQSFDFNSAHSLDVLPIQPFPTTAQEAQPMQTRLALYPAVPIPSTPYSDTGPDPRDTFPIVPSTYSSYVAAFEVRELSAFTPHLKERFGNIVGSAHDVCQDFLLEMTKEFRDVLDQIRDLVKIEEDRGIGSLLAEFTYDRGLPSPNGSSPRQTAKQQNRDRDLNWQASTLKGVHRRRDLMVQQLNLLRKSRMVAGSGSGPYLVRKLNYGPHASFLDCLQIELGEWKRLWEIIHVEYERVRLMRERMSTLAKLWGVRGGWDMVRG
ncbi:hypothetical protein MMC11_001728 [Xylographa trunciseda]|nr:hypothetical protein [Xylographa trunciseda]